ncbi:MAG: hypothetical protein MI725_03210, partial [Pirellulales bacterium]|nr:hypothetical protein [Pirellulales bacterium]
EHTGLLVPPGDSKALANALERLANDSTWRADLGRHARRRILEDFDLAKNTETILRLFSREETRC